MSKKVILFIVEGVTDKNSPALIFSRILRNDKVEFHIVNGDITSRLDTTPQNCISKVNEEIVSFLNVNRFKRSDLLRIVHLIDTDGIYVSDELIMKGDNEKIVYTPNNMITKDINKTKDRNSRKSKILNKLYSSNNIKSIRYNMYYFSCNLEHVLHDEQNLEGNLKDEYSDSFVDKYYGNEESFLEFINNSDFSVSGDYNETWNFIKAGKNSLKRYCNLKAFFEE